MNVLALCSGVGGLEMGLHLAGASSSVVCYVEREAYAVAVLVARMEAKQLDSAPIWDDVTTFDGEPWRGVVDCITAGYPCQPFSSAGRRKGTADERWLWKDIARITDEVAPAIVFLENVPRHIRHGLDEVWRDLRSMGFRIEAGTFSAQEVGANHIRERLFILAAHPDRDPLRFVAERGESAAQSPESRNTEPGYTGTPGTLSNTDSEGLEERLGERNDSTAKCTTAQRNDSSYTDSNRQQGQPKGRACSGESQRDDIDRLRHRFWETEPMPQPAIQRMADGVARQLDVCLRSMRNDRLYVIGNGVVPQTAALAWKTLTCRFEFA